MGRVEGQPDLREGGNLLGSGRTRRAPEPTLPGRAMTRRAADMLFKKWPSSVRKHPSADCLRTERRCSLRKSVRACSPSRSFADPYASTK